jgi:ribosomal subunit interface protein
MEVVYRGVRADLGLRQYVGLRLMSVLDQLERNMENVTVLLDDIPDGGGRRCRMVARLASDVPVAVDQTSSVDLYASIDKAAERLAELARIAVAGRRPAARSAAPTVEVRARGFGLTDPLRSHAQRRLAPAVGRFDGLRSVSVDVDDLKGPNGGVDKRCQMTARLVDGEVRVEVLDEDAYRAIDRAANRLRRAVARQVDRRRERTPRPLTRPSVHEDATGGGNRRGVRSARRPRQLG